MTDAGKRIISANTRAFARCLAPPRCCPFRPSSSAKATMPGLSPATCSSSTPIPRSLASSPAIRCPTTQPAPTERIPTRPPPKSSPTRTSSRSGSTTNSPTKPSSWPASTSITSSGQPPIPTRPPSTPAFGVTYVDHQRNGIVTYTRTVSPRFTFQSSISFTRTTPQFPTPDHTDPAVKFNDGLYEGFNTAGGSVMTAYGNLFQGQQNFTIIAGKHVIKTGGEVRLNRDTTYFGISPNGEYDFGGGTAYSPVDIPSQSGMHDIQAGEALPGYTLRSAHRQAFRLHRRSGATLYLGRLPHRPRRHLPQRRRSLRPGHLEGLRPLYLRLRPALGDLFAHHRTRQAHLGLS